MTDVNAALKRMRDTTNAREAYHTLMAYAYAWKESRIHIVADTKREENQR